MNPLLPDNCFLPDAEAHLMSDGRLYLYGSWDISGNNDYCSREVHCFSTDDMINWIDHGAVFRNDESFVGLPWAKDSYLYAPDAIEKDGKYYLYICGNNGEEGVAVADSPAGPFSVAERLDIADGSGIDPAVFVDDDGRAYYLWGQFSLNGGELSGDMKSLIPESVKGNIITEYEHGFHEGASLRKRNGKYYLVYTDISRGKATCMSYAVSDFPLGPYKKGGVIIDNVYCDPSTWNNHGSIAEYNGQWYVFYHRSSQNRNTCRRVCAEPILFDKDGYIREVEQTSQGASAPLCAYESIPARAACRIMGESYIAHVGGKEVLSVSSKGHWNMPDWAEYKYIDFGSSADAHISHFCVLTRGKGRITLKIDGSEEISLIDVDNDAFEYNRAYCKDIRGIHPLWLFVDGDLLIEEFHFE